jgi:hypothetical protein
MKFVRFLIALSALTVTSSCDRSPTGVPQPPAPTSLAGRLAPTGALQPWAPSLPTGLLACSELPYESVTQVVGPEGGTISIGPHTLLIPAGALTKSVSITAVIDTGLGRKTLLVRPPEGRKPKKDFVAVNSVRFKPKLKFQSPAYLTMSYANCDLGGPGQLLPAIVYTNPVLNVILENEPALDSPDAQSLTAGIDHFSNYAVAWAKPPRGR